jgi:hypothetical protein
MNTRIALALFARTAIKSVLRELLGIRTMSQSKQSAMLINSAPRVEMWPSPKLSDKRMQSRRNDEEVYDDKCCGSNTSGILACKEPVALQRPSSGSSADGTKHGRVVRAVDLWNTHGTTINRLIMRAFT